MRLHLVPCLLAAALLGCSDERAEPTALLPGRAPAERLLEAFPGLGPGTGLELLGADFLAAPAAAPEGWTRFDYKDSAGQRVVAFVRAVETYDGDLEYEVDVERGPVRLRLSRAPLDAGPIPTDPTELESWLLVHSRTGKGPEWTVAAGEAESPVALLRQAGADGGADSSRVVLVVEYLAPTAVVGHVALRRAPRFETPREGRVFSSPDATRGPTLGQVNVAGDVRRALVLPTGESSELKLSPDSLAGRLTLRFGLVALPGLEPSAMVPLRFELTLAAEGKDLVRETFELDPLERVLDRFWSEHSIDLEETGVSAAAARGVPIVLSLQANLLAGAAQTGNPTAVAIAGLELLGGTTPRVRPNLFLVSLDTLRGDHVGPDEAGRSLTPHLDAFARQSLVFESAVSVAPFTLPTHASVFSGVLPTSHGATDVRTPLRLATPMVAELLLAAGWNTAAFTGGGFLSPDFGFVRGFERYTVHDPLITLESLPPRRSTQGPAAAALTRVAWENELRLLAAHLLKWPAPREWLEAQRSAPLFLFLHTYAAHQYLPPKRLFDEELADTKSALTRGPALGELSNERFQREPLSAADEEHLRRLYGACVRHADEGFAEFLAYLETSGLAASSYVVVFSDHGEELFEHGDFGHSNELRQTLLDVPLMIRGPGIEPLRVPEPVSLLDLAPTLLTLVGESPDPAFAGRSLVAPEGAGFAVAARVATSEAGVFSEVSHHEHHKDSLILGTYKLVRDYGSEGRGAEFRDRLYDLSSDPGEFEDLAQVEPDRAAALGVRLAAWRAATDARAAGKEVSLDVSEATEQQLKDLGYL